MADNHDEQPTIAGLEPPRFPAGDLEEHVKKQLDALDALGYLEEHHAGQRALALTCARDLDRSFGRGAPSGRANLLRVMNEILESLPQPEAASADKLAEVVAALKDADDEEVFYPDDVRTDA